MASRTLFYTATAYNYAIMIDDDDFIPNGIDTYYEMYLGVLSDLLSKADVGTIVPIESLILGSENIGIENSNSSPCKNLGASSDLGPSDLKPLSSINPKSLNPQKDILAVKINIPIPNVSAPMWSLMFLPNSHAIVQTINHTFGEDSYFTNSFKEYISSIANISKLLYLYLWPSTQGYSRNELFDECDLENLNELSDKYNLSNNDVLNNIDFMKNIENSKIKYSPFRFRYDSIIEISKITKTYVGIYKNRKYAFITNRPIYNYEFGLKPRRFYIYNDCLYSSETNEKITIDDLIKYGIYLNENDQIDENEEKLGALSDLGSENLIFKIINNYLMTDSTNFEEIKKKCHDKLYWPKLNYNPKYVNKYLLF